LAVVRGHQACRLKPKRECFFGHEKGAFTGATQRRLGARESPLALSRTTALNGVLLKQEKEMIEAALAESQGQISGPTGAATKLGLPARTLDSKIKRLRINKYRFKVPRAI